MPQGGTEHPPQPQDPPAGPRTGQQGWTGGLGEPPAPHEVSRRPFASCPAHHGLTTERSLMAAAPPPRAGSNNGKQIAELGNVSSTLAFQDTRLRMKTQLCRHHLNDRPNFKGLQTISFAAPPPQ